MRPSLSDLTRRLRSILAACAVASVVVAGPAPSGAQQPPPDPAPAGEADGTLTWSVRPTPRDDERPNFSYEVEAGETIRDSLRVRNFGDEELSLVVYASDAIVTSSGALDLLPAGEPPTGVGAWVRLGSGLVTLPPGEHVDIPFVLTVPAQAESGDHSGGIVTSFVTEGTGDDGQPVRLDRRLGSRMHVRVSGELRPELAVSDMAVSYDGSLLPLRSGTLHVAYTVTNVGNVRLGADQAIRVRGPGGVLGRELVLDQMPELLPGSSLSFTAEVGGVWPMGRAEAVVELTTFPTRDGDEFPPDTLTASASTATWALPWPQATTVVLVVAAVLAARWLRRRRARQEARRVQAAVDAALAEAPDAPVPA